VLEEIFGGDNGVDLVKLKKENPGITAEEMMAAIDKKGPVTP
jgi:hypothetical protein